MCADAGEYVCNVTIVYFACSYDCLFCNYAWASSEIKVLKSIFIVILKFVPS